MIDSLFGVQQGHKHQRNAEPPAVLEVGIARAGIEKCLTLLLQPGAVIKIRGVELLEQELVPRVMTLVELGSGRCWRLRVTFDLALAFERHG
jgi:hypothetical protein